MKYKKGSVMTDTVIVMGVVALLAVLIMFTFYGYVDKGVGLGNMYTSDSAQKGCIGLWESSNTGEDISDYDIDGDKIVDSCDVCVPIKMSTEQFATLKKKAEFMLWLDLRTEKAASEVTYEDYLKLFKNDYFAYDSDSDGIIDACDTDVDKKAKKSLFDKDKVIENECNAIAGIGLDGKSRDSKGDYTICRVSFVS